MRHILMLSLLLTAALPNVVFAEDEDEAAEDFAPAAVFPRDAELFKQLKAREGVFQLVENDEKNPCNLNIREDKTVRLSATVTQVSDEYGAKPGDVNFLLQQKYSHDGKYHRAFDRADFSRLNQGRKASSAAGMKIAHTAGYNHRTATLTHIVKMSEFLKGSATTTQTLVFDADNNGFSYVYTNFTGVGTSTGWGTAEEVLNSCRFKRVE